MLELFDARINKNKCVCLSKTLLIVIRELQKIPSHIVHLTVIMVVIMFFTTKID